MNWFDGDDVLPPTIHIALERAQELRYGENPHQDGARYRNIGGSSFWDGVDTARRHGAVAISTSTTPRRRGRPRTTWATGPSPSSSSTPIRVAWAWPTTLAEAYQLAFDCDPRSAFGGIVAVNRVIDHATVEEMVAAAQADVVIAPGYDDGVIEALAKKRKNTRVLTATPPTCPAP